MEFKVGDKVEVRSWVRGNMIPRGGQVGEVIQLHQAGYLPVQVKTPAGTGWYKSDELQAVPETKR